jgi:hypothetical protein
MTNRGYKFGKAVAGNLTILLTTIAVFAVIYSLWTSGSGNKKELVPVVPVTGPLDACQADHGERLQKATTLLKNSQFDQAADVLYVCIQSLSDVEREVYIKALTAGNEARAKLAEEGMGWQYVEESDPMTSKTTSSAILRSSSSLNLSAPYSGTNFGGLVVRKHPRYGTDVVFKIDQGQLMCSSISGCPIKVRFDDGDPMNFSGTEAADHNPTVVFINEKQRFIAAASKAKHILVQVNIFHNGAPVIEFYTPNLLTWKPAK